MHGTEGISDKIISAIITGIVGLVFLGIQRLFSPGAKVAYWIPHDFTFRVPLPNQPQPLLVQTATLTVQNLGRKAAEDVEITHRTKPDHFQLHPPRTYEETTGADGTYKISIGSLGPKEYFQMQVFSHMTPPVLAGVRSKDGPAKSIRFQVNRQLSKPALHAVRACIIVGAATIVYWIVWPAILLMRATGVL
ncbi:hypothetical protein ACFQ3P_13830 [Paraburkholderia sabiae]|uniref:Uncharacterized protein n=1 Tax=Paraburkholderia sabiae TaxID=273251 RepID=A0ABU9QL37_9BURK|nr:hypothetical protein [Paraburkholderia sabiae]WJZ76179.1 hypothetical protein QEN71_10370 [Paraburkholderia sabiae]CAD6525886.1 hypothetical protein LMG24235_01894 [Paraburkholderia sabiae]